jgi:hypothetical protein
VFVQVRKCKYGRRELAFVFIVVSIFAYGLWTVNVDDVARSIIKIKASIHCVHQQSCHLPKRCQVFRGFDDLGDDKFERFGDDMNVKDKLVEGDELDVIEQCYGVKPVLMSRMSVKPNKSDSGKH